MPIDRVCPLEQPTRLQILKGASPFSVNYLCRTDSRSGACGGNKARYARMSKPRPPCGETCSGGSDLGGEQTRRPEHNEMSASSKTSPRKVAFAEQKTVKPTHSGLGKAADTEEETGESTRCTVGVGDQASGERFAEIESGRSRGQQRLAATCKDSSN